MLDIRTMFFMLVLSSIVAGIGALGLDVKAERRRSAQSWGLGSFSISLGIVLLGLRDIIPLWPSAVLGNSLMFWGFLLIYISLRQLLQKPLAPRRYILIAIAYLVIFHFLITLDVLVRYRMTFGAVVFSLLAIAMIRTARGATSQHTKSASALMQGSYYIVLITWLTLGLHSLLFASNNTTILEQSPVRMLNFVGYYFGIIGAGMAYLLMQNGLAYSDLAIIANKDALTGVRNRRNLMEMAERDWALAQRMHRPFSVMMLDLDHFKMINDEFGHIAGDEVLRRFGEILLASVRTEDLVGRYGGEEFCIVLTDTSPGVAHQRAEHIRQQLEAAEIQVGTQRLPRITVSTGIAGNTAGDRSLQQLLRAADTALYAAKAMGRNCIHSESLTV